MFLGDISSYASEEEKLKSKENRQKPITFIKKYIKCAIPIILITWFTSVLMPPKEYLPYIFFADDAAKIVMTGIEGINESITEGKLQKINELIDLKLDKTIKDLKGTKDIK